MRNVTTSAPNPSYHVLPLLPISATRLFDKLSPSTTQDNWTPLKTALLANGYRVALLQGVIAILINHIRRTLIPWLGTFMFYHPLEDLRLAISNPDVFLGQTVSSSWAGALLSLLQRWLTDALALWTTSILISNLGRVPQTTRDRVRTSPRAVVVTLEGLMHLCKISVGVYVLMTLDYVFCRSIHTVSCVIAFCKLATGGAGGHIVLEQELGTHKAQSVLVLWMAYYYLFHGFRPAVSRALVAAVRGRLGLLVALMSVGGGVWATITWRARLYILLEMGPMFVVLGELLGLVVLLAREFVDDPLGMKAKAAVAKRQT